MTGLEQTKKLAVWLASSGQIQRNLHPLKITLSSGAKRLPTCEMELAGTIDLGTDSVFPIQGEPQGFTPNTPLATKYQDEYCYVTKDVTTGDPTEIYHFGVITSWKVSSSPDRLVLISTMPEDVFGSSIYEGRFSTGSTQKWSDLDIVFNPISDSVPIENCIFNATANKKFSLVHPDDNTVASALGTRIFWDHESILTYLLDHHMNATSPIDKARSIANFTSATVAASLPRPENISIPKGTKLLSAIERIMDPVGIEFAIVPFLGNVTAPKSAKYEIVFWPREQGRAAVTSSQFYLGDWNLVTSDAATITQADLEVGLFDNNATTIKVLGDPIQYEVTVELQKGWGLDFEEQAKAEMFKINKSASDPILDANLRPVFRDWVLNEDGGYPTLNTPTSTDIFGANTASYVSRTRKFLPCLTLGTDGTPIGKFRGIDVEWWDGNEWKAFEEGIEIMEHRCGIRINQDTVPPKLMRPDARVRVTATIETDDRLQSTILRQSSVPGRTNIDTIAVIETRDKFKYNQVVESSKYSGAGQAALDRDDQQAIQDYAQRAANGWCRLNYKGRMVVEDVDLTANNQMGKYIPNLGGRSVALNTTTLANRHPVITGFTMDFETQLTTYFTETETGGEDA